MQTSSLQTACAIIAGFLHYLFLACFFWMLVEAVMLFLMVRNLKVVNYFSSRNIKMLHLCAFGYGLPVLVVIISASVQPRGYGMHNRWVSFFLYNDLVTELHDNYTSYSIDAMTKYLIIIKLREEGFILNTCWRYMLHHCREVRKGTQAGTWRWDPWKKDFLWLTYGHVSSRSTCLGMVLSTVV